MCVGIPGKVIRVNPVDKLAVIEVFDIKRRISTALLHEVALGDYLMVHAGYAIEKLDLEEAEERLKLWREILKDELPLWQKEQRSERR